jgi:hypothetical protein
VEEEVAPEPVLEAVPEPAVVEKVVSESVVEAVIESELKTVAEEEKTAPLPMVEEEPAASAPELSYSVPEPVSEDKDARLPEVPSPEPVIEAVETIAEAAAVPVMEEDVWEDADSEEQFESFDESEDLEAPYWEDLVDPDATS